MGDAILVGRCCFCRTLARLSGTPQVYEVRHVSSVQAVLGGWKGGPGYPAPPGACAGAPIGRAGPQKRASVADAAKERRARCCSCPSPLTESAA
jgi:hypothetical protein